MLAILPMLLLGIWTDPRTVAGSPVWLKPAKFALSLGIYSLTLVWMFAWLPDHVRLRRLVGRLSAGIFAVEFAIIAGQAARGVGSHFNVATPLDGVLFGVMGVAILLQTMGTAAVLVVLWRQPFTDEQAVGWGLRLGMLLTVVAALTGGLMTSPTPAQRTEAHLTGRMTVSGAHTVGAPDGGAGLPGTGWSTTHGDLRVAHFVGLHAMQVLPLVALVARRRYAARGAVRLVMVAAGSHGALFVLLLVQALRGQSVVRPDGTTFLTLAAWAALTVAGALLVARRQPGTAGSRHLVTQP
jgi:hypothetical protein